MQSGDTTMCRSSSGTVGLHVTQAFYTLQYTLPDEMPLVQHFALGFYSRWHVAKLYKIHYHTSCAYGTSIN